MTNGERRGDFKKTLSHPPSGGLPPRHRVSMTGVPAVADVDAPDTDPSQF